MLHKKHTNIKSCYMEDKNLFKCRSHYFDLPDLQKFPFLWIQYQHVQNMSVLGEVAIGGSVTLLTLLHWSIIFSIIIPNSVVQLACSIIALISMHGNLSVLTEAFLTRSFVEV